MGAVWGHTAYNFAGYRCSIIFAGRGVGGVVESGRLFEIGDGNSGSGFWVCGRGKGSGRGRTQKSVFCQTNPILSKPAWKSLDGKAKNEANFWGSGASISALLRGSEARLDKLSIRNWPSRQNVRRKAAGAGDTQLAIHLLFNMLQTQGCAWHRHCSVWGGWLLSLGRDATANRISA